MRWADYVTEGAQHTFTVAPARFYSGVDFTAGMGKLPPFEIDAGQRPGLNGGLGRAHTCVGIDPVGLRWLGDSCREG